MAAYSNQRVAAIIIKILYRMLKPIGDIYKKQLPTIGMMIGSRYRIWIRPITG